MKIFFILLVFPFIANAQLCRYNERIFTSYDKTANVIYGNAPALNSPYILENNTTNQNLQLDIFEPSADTAQKRALIIFAHSGGFFNGTKDNQDMQALCDSFSKRGYVTASLNYRLGFNPLSSNASERAVWRGIQDASAAVRFFKHNATLYRIDTTNIFLWGSSAGAFMALGLAYVDDAERPASTFAAFLRPNLGCKDCTGNNYTNTSLVTGIISCWGATKDTAWIQNNNNIPVQLFHGTADGTVPYTEGYPFGLSTITYVRGSQEIDEQLNRTSIYHEFYAEQGLDHEYWGTSNGTFIPGGPTVYWLDIITKAKNFMLGRLVSPPACGVVPITLTNFYGKLINDTVNLYWNTALELNVKNIIVEKSSDAVNFNQQFTTSPKGINGTGAAYSTIDVNPYSGINYYRLKIVDLDGTYSYSDVIRINTPVKDMLLITQTYPNPVHDFINIELQSGKNQQIAISVFDFTGKQILTKTIQLKKGINITNIPMQQVATGIFMVQVSNKQDGYSATLKIIKQ
ncbi:MAG TPA: carboxylesterase family protein [Ferruginibacter sp.]|nr:carboxylesterase family protein [Ferruginibacter sp.]